MIKKYMLAILAAVMIITGIPVSSFAVESSEAQCEFERNFLQNLGVLTNVDLANSTSEVSRKDFVYFLSKLLKLSEFPEVNIEYFDDVKSDDSCSELINYFAQVGYVSKGGNFEPDRAIKPIEAYKILQTILGYNAAAEVKGGYPSGYIVIANRLDWSVKGSVITSDDLIRLLFDAANTPYYSITSITENGNAEYTDKTDNTILSAYYNIESTEEFVGAVNGIVLEGKDCDVGELCAGGKIYLNGDVNKPETFLGRQCEIYYYDNPGERNKLFAVRVAAGDNSKVIDSSLIKNMGNDLVLEYYKNRDDEKNSKISRIRIDPSVKVIVNGAVADRNIVSLFNGLEYGNVVLQKSNGSGNYDYAIIKNYRDIYISRFNTDENIIYDKLSGKNYKINDFRNVNIYTVTGEKKSAASLSGETLVSVATDDRDNIEIICGLDKLSGNVVSSFSDGIKVNDIKYYYSNEFKKMNYPIIAGNIYTIYLNPYSEIAYMRAGDADEMDIGYVLDVDSGSGLDPVVRFKVYSTAGKLLELDAADKIRLDGIRKESNAVYDYFMQSGEINDQLVRYSLDADGRIAKIDTSYVSEKESRENSLTESVMVDDNKSNSMYMIYYSGNANMRRIGLANMADKNTKIIQVPTADCIKNRDYNEYSFRTGGFDDILVADMSLDVKCYKFDSSKLTEDVVVVYKDTAKAYDDYFAGLLSVEQISSGLNADGVVAKQVEGYMGGAQVCVPIALNYNASNALPKAGDVIAPNLNQRGELVSYHTCYDYSENKVCTVSGGSRSLVDFGSTKYYQNATNINDVMFELSYGYAYDISGVTMTISAAPETDNPGCIDQMVNVGTIGFTMIEDDNRGGVKLSTGDISDISTFKDTVDLSNTSKVIIRNRYRTIKEIIVIK